MAVLSCPAVSSHAASYTGCSVWVQEVWLCCLMHWVQKVVAVLPHALGAGGGGCAASCTGCRRWWLCCFMHWVQEVVAVLPHALGAVSGCRRCGCAASCTGCSVWVQEVVAVLPHALGPEGGGCFAVCYWLYCTVLYCTVHSPTDNTAEDRVQSICQGLQRLRTVRNKTVSFEYFNSISAHYCAIAALLWSHSSSTATLHCIISSPALSANRISCVLTVSSPVPPSPLIALVVYLFSKPQVAERH